MTPLRDALHEEYYHDDRLVLFRCTECGQTRLSLGALHGHVERHRGYTRFNIQPPFGPRSFGDLQALMESTEVLAVDDVESVPFEEVVEA